jgi:hypothetical protein
MIETTKPRCGGKNMKMIPGKGKRARPGIGVVLLAFLPLVWTAPAYAEERFAFTSGILSVNGQNNTDAEPQIRADGDGRFFLASERGLANGTDAWRSSDNGKTYTYLGQPNALSRSASGLNPGGGDTDVAVATEKNAAGQYNVYIASLSLANVDVSTSTDGGQSFTTNYASAVIPLDDREWIAADGVSTVYLSYHDITTGNIDINKSIDAGQSWSQAGEAINPLDDPSLVDAAGNNELGNLAVDPSNHYIYQIFATSDSALSNLTGGPLNTVWMAVSRDGGQTFHDYRVYRGNLQKSYANNFPQVTVDGAGNVYALFSDDQNVYYTVSTDYGQHWRPPLPVNSGAARTAIFPWSGALGNGGLDIVYYATSGSAVDGPNAADDDWYVYMAQVKNATSPTPAIQQIRVTPNPVHHGGVCQGGVTCGPTDNRDLFDDFGVAVSPLTGFASIAYSDDAPSYTPSSDHTEYATQTAGPSLLPDTSQTGPTP